jgi:hypothetical protein
MLSMPFVPDLPYPGAKIRIKPSVNTVNATTAEQRA